MEPTRRQRALALLQGKEEGWSPRELAEVLDADEGTVLEDLRHLRRSLKRTGLALHMLPTKCPACGWVAQAEEPHNPGKCPRCKATRLMPPRFRVGPA